MKEDLKNIINKLIDSDKSIQLRLFNIVAITGFVGGILSLIISFMIDVPLLHNAVIFSSLVFVAIFLFLANSKNMVNLASAGAVAMVSLLVFPLIFFTGGGAESGMSLWFALGIILNFMLVRGKFILPIFLLQTATIIVCYVMHYLSPTLILGYPSRKSVIIDVVQSIIVFSTSMGIICKLQQFIYERKIEQIKSKINVLEDAEKIALTASQAKSDFLSNMSHEIRTPINAVLGMNEMILRESTDKKIKDYATEVQTSGKALLSIINDVLDISKIESGRIELVSSEYKLKDVILNSYKMIAEKSERKKLATSILCSPNLPISLKGDEKRIQQILVNILTNAVKYTEKGSVEFAIDGHIKGNKVKLTFSIKDTGIGIKEADLDKVFEKFVRTDLVHNRNIEGTGLGLSITKQLIELMNGTLELKSTYGKGTEFIVHLAQEIVDFAPIGEFDVSKIASSRVRVYHQSFEAPEAHILAVDDVDINLIIFANLLKETKLKIDTAESGFKCLELASQNHYDVIFMDHMMPEMDGIQTLKKLREIQDCPNASTPVIMLTANALTGVRDEYVSAGFNDYLSKPIEGKFLEEMLLKYLPAEKVQRTGIVTE